MDSLSYSYFFRLCNYLLVTVKCNLFTVHIKLQLLFNSNVNSNCALCATTVATLLHNIGEINNWSNQTVPTAFAILYNIQMRVLSICPCQSREWHSHCSIIVSCTKSVLLVSNFHLFQDNHFVIFFLNVRIPFSLVLESRTTGNVHHCSLVCIVHVIRYWLAFFKLS